MTQKISEIEKKITDHNHNKYITTTEFNALPASVFNAKIAQVGLVTKTDFDAKFKKIVTELLQINLNICLLKTN